MAATFRVSISTPERMFFEGDVERLVFQAADGEVAVLAGHQPMVLSLTSGMLRFVMPGGEGKWAAASDGFATVMPDMAYVMLETAEWPEEIDVRRAQDARDEAQEILRQKKSQQEYTLAHAMLARAMVRLRVTDRKHNT